MMYKRPSSKINCSFCGVEFSKENREIRKTSNHYCSSTCTGKACSKRSNPLAYNKNIAKKNAKSKGLDFDLTSDFLFALYLEQGKKCALTGVNITPVDKSKKSLSQVSIDRIDNDKGYVQGNVHLVALGINYMRNTCSLDDALEFLKSLKDQLVT